MGYVLFRFRSDSEWQQALIRTSIVGTLVFLLLLTTTLSVVRVGVGNPFAAATLPYVALATLAVWGIYVADKKRPNNSLGGVLLIVLYAALGTAMTCRVGVGAAAAILFSAVIILASALHGFWLALLPTELIAAGLFVFRTSELHGIVHPAYVFVPQPTNYDSVVALIILLHVLLLACGAVYHYLLQVNRRLQASQTEKIRQLYRFAEIGEICTALIHDLANGLTLLSLEVDNVKPQATNDITIRIKKKVTQLSNTLHIARAQMSGRHHREEFDLAEEVTQIVASIRPIARLGDVTLEWTGPTTPVPYACERILFQQVLTILLKNAVDSYEQSRRASKEVKVSLVVKDSAILLTITDWGKPIKPSEQEHIFEPFYSTKKDGMGMGLYLTKRFIEDSLGGAIELQATQKKKLFSISLPTSVDRAS